MGLPRPPRAPAPAAGPAPDEGTFQAVRSHGARFSPRPVHGEDPARQHGPVGRRGPPAGALVVLAFTVVATYLFGWYAAYYGTIPGVYLAADLGMPALAIMLLRTAGRTLNERVHDPVVAKATGALPKAAAAALVVFAFFLTFTNVLQMAIGLGGGILAFQVFVSRSRLRRAGYQRLGPGASLAVAGVVGFGLWRGVRAVVGFLPGFELLSLGYAFVFLIVFLRMTRAAVGQAALMRRDPTIADHARQPGGAATQKVVVSLVVGYLVFRVFISTAIPYGPVIEWLLVCLAALFFAIFAADRIGTVPTRQSLPASDVRTHVQRVTNLPDRRLAETQQHLERFVNTGLGADWVHARLDGLLLEGGVPAELRQEVLSPLVADPRRPHRHETLLRSMSRQQRGQLVSRALETLRRARDPTGTLKANRPVGSERRARTAASSASTPPVDDAAAAPATQAFRSTRPGVSP